MGGLRRPRAAGFRRLLRRDSQKTDMPNSPSAKKSMRKAEVRRERNRSDRSALRNVLKRCRAAAARRPTPAAAETAFRLAVKKLDQAAANHLIHKNTAARTKSRLSPADQEAGQLTFAPTGAESVLALYQHRGTFGPSAAAVQSPGTPSGIYPAGDLSSSLSASVAAEPLRNQFSISASSAGAAAGSLMRPEAAHAIPRPGNDQASTTGIPTAVIHTQSRRLTMGCAAAVDGSHSIRPSSRGDERLRL